MVNGVPRNTEALYDFTSRTWRANETRPIPTPAATPCSAARSRVVLSTRMERRTGREGLIASDAIRSQFSTGRKKSTQTQGDRPASRARRSVIDTPIQRKGRDQSASATHSHSGAGPSVALLAENNGLT